MKMSKFFLETAGMASFAIALFQAVIFFSISWSRYFGAPEVLLFDPMVLILVGFVIVVIFIIFGSYALSATGRIRRLPFLRSGLLIIGSIYTLRGLIFIPVFLGNAGILQTSTTFPAKDIISSAISLIIGILYLTGTIGYWSALPSQGTTDTHPIK
jgi:hypothetical protein